MEHPEVACDVLSSRRKWTSATAMVSPIRSVVAQVGCGAGQKPVVHGSIFELMGYSVVLYLVGGLVAIFGIFPLMLGC